MSRYAEQPLQKITMNIFLSDYLALKELYGQGYTEVIRAWIQRKVKEERDGKGHSA